MEDVIYPPEPEKPLASDCCGTGCKPCVLDIYEEELTTWQRQCEDIKKHGFIINKEHKDKHFQEEDVIKRATYQTYPITDIVQDIPDTCVYTFQLSKSHYKLPLKVGQHLLCRVQFDSENITRQYTPVSNCTQCAGQFKVAIKIYSNGQMSKHIQNWRVGSKVEWRGPFGGFSYYANQFENMVLLAAGTGIAPMTQVIREILNNEEDETVIYLLYSIKTYDDIICKSLIDDWKDYWNFKVIYFLTQVAEDNIPMKFGEKGINCRIQKHHIQDLFKNSLSNTYFCICGTKSFDKDMINHLNGLNIQKDNFFKF